MLLGERIAIVRGKKRIGLRKRRRGSEVKEEDGETYGKGVKRVKMVVESEV